MTKDFKLRGKIVKKIINAFKNILPYGKNEWLIVLYTLIHSVLIYYSLEASTKNMTLNGVWFTIINIVTIYVIEGLISLVIRKRWISQIILSTILTILGAANFYTIMYRNLPVTFQDIFNIKTAQEVMVGYKFPVTINIVAILVSFVLQLVIVVLTYKIEKANKKTFLYKLKKNVGLLVFSLVFIFSIYISPKSIIPEDIFKWSWVSTYKDYGYTVSSIEIWKRTMDVVRMPEGYSLDELKEDTKQLKGNKNGEKTPDIIIILNETLYDLKDVLDIETDAPYMPFIDSIKIKGKAVVPGECEGTNNSEYSLLSSNPYYLMKGITPFNYLNFDNTNSVVSYMNDLGYTTWGAHCASPANYKRGVVYPKLGFDKILFLEDFGKIESYCSRVSAEDSFCYEKMLMDYENMGDDPRFQYLLTIQNHGGWDMNLPEEDIVHSLTDFGELTDDIDEYLSCIKRSDDAFLKLCEYFKSSERDVVICMVGDHAPSFLSDLVDKSKGDNSIALKSTPYVVWSNFEIEENALDDRMSLEYIVPALFEAAGVKLSPYYNFLTELKKDVPIITSTGICKDKDGNLFDCAEENQYSDRIALYFNMAYNNIVNDESKIERLFKAE